MNVLIFTVGIVGIGVAAVWLADAVEELIEHGYYKKGQRR